MPARKNWVELLTIKSKEDKATNLTINNVPIEKIKKCDRDMKCVFICECGNKESRTIRSIIEKYGNVESKKVVIVGDILHSRVALSNIYCLKMLGAHVAVCGPLTLMPKYLNELGVKYFSNINEALNWCDIANVLRIQLERQDVNLFPSLREYSNIYGIDLDLLNSLSKEITIMHPGPINRGVELSSDVADSDHSLILDQVENGVAIRMAVLYLLSNKN